MQYCVYAFPFICVRTYLPSAFVHALMTSFVSTHVNLCLLMCLYPHLCPSVCLCPYLCLLVQFYSPDHMLAFPSVSVPELCPHLCLFVCLCLHLWLFMHALPCSFVLCACVCLSVCVWMRVCVWLSTSTTWCTR